MVLRSIITLAILHTTGTVKIHVLNAILKIQRHRSRTVKLYTWTLTIYNAASGAYGFVDGTRKGRMRARAYRNVSLPRRVDSMDVPIHVVFSLSHPRALVQLDPDSCRTD